MLRDIKEKESPEAVMEMKEHADAARIIQRFVRKKRAVKFAELQKQKEDAAIMIQAKFRSH